MLRGDFFFQLGGGAAEVPGHQDAQQGQQDMTPSRLQRAFTWARNRSGHYLNIFLSSFL